MILSLVKPGNDERSLNHFLKSLNRLAERSTEVAETTLVFAAGVRR